MDEYPSDHSIIAKPLSRRMIRISSRSNCQRSGLSILQPLKPLVKPHGQAARQDLNGNRRGSRRAPIADRSTQCPTGDDVRLPMRLGFQSREGIVHRQYLERPDPRIFPRVVRDEGRHETGLQSHFAARKTLIVAAFEPCIGIVALTGPGTAESVLQQLRADAGNYRSIDRLPQRMPQFVVVPKPQAPGYFKSDHTRLECVLVLARPNTVLIERQFVIDPKWSAGIGTARKQRQ